MRKIGQRAVFVETLALIRNSIEKYASGSNSVEMNTQGAEWIFAMFEHVVGDDEIERCAGEASESFAVLDYIRLNQIASGQFRVITAQLCNADTIDVFHLCSRGHGQSRAPISMPCP